MYRNTHHETETSLKVQIENQKIARITSQITSITALQIDQDVDPVELLCKKVKKKNFRQETYFIFVDNFTVFTVNSRQQDQVFTLSNSMTVPWS